MGWNDRLPEDPYWPDYQQQQELESYEQWLQYLDQQLDDANAELSSQTLTPEDLRRLSGILATRRKTELRDEEEFARDSINVQEKTRQGP